MIIQTSAPLQEHNILAPAHGAMPSHRRYCWTLRHGYYATMGGFVFDTSPQPISNYTTRFVITPKGLKFIMEHMSELIPDISEEDIGDKSKADSTGKALLAWQAFYFVVSCAIRSSQSLPLSLLEISTLAHAVCTILTYIVWWRKPVSIDVPTSIDGNAASRVAALLLCKSCSTRYLIAGLLRLHALPEIEFLRLSSYEPEHIYLQLPAGDDSVSVETKMQYNLTEHIGITIDDPPPGHSSSPLVVHTGHALPWYVHARDSCGKVHSHVKVTMTDIRRWRLAAQCIEEYGLDDSMVPNGIPFAYVSVREGLQSAIHWTHLDFIKNGTGMRWSIAATALVSSTYGLAHLLGWNAQFPSDHERKLWRLASLVHSVYSPIITTTVFFINRHVTKEEVYRNAGRTHMMLFVWNVIWPVLPEFCSGYLLVESLRQLSYLPPGAYQVPSWTKYWPHFA
jgi:hypothetical protein